MSADLALIANDPTSLDVAAIQVVGRHRMDLGDIDGLAASIAADGLLHPVVVTASGRLVAGARRLAAVRALGWGSVPVTVVGNVEDAAVLLHMERDENECRKEMTPSERVSLGRALEELERPKAQERVDQGRERSHAVRRGESLGPVQPNGAKKGDTREIVAPAVGMSTATYSRAKRLVVAAEEGDERAAEAVAEMDRTGSVSRAHDGWLAKARSEPKPATRLAADDATRLGRIRELAEQGYASPQIATALGRHGRRAEEHIRHLAASHGIAIPADAAVSRTRRIDSNNVMDELVATLDSLGVSMRVINLNDLDAARTEEWANSLTESIRALNRFTKQIKELAP